MENAIIADDSVFDDLFIPTHLVAREGHVREIANCLSPSKAGRQPTHAFIHGPPGVGKTLVCKWILKEHFPGKHAYVNVWSKRTSHKIIEEILNQTGTFVNGRESTSELEKRLRALDKKLIICLDESDHLKDRDILYTLASNCHGLILISNNPHSLSDLDDRITSRVLLNEIEFNPYTREEILSILNERIRYGFKEGTLDPNLATIVAGMSDGDARIGLQILKMAAREAELKGLKRLTIEEIKKASKCTRKHRLSYLIAKLNDHQKTIYNILNVAKRMDSGKLFEQYCKSVNEPLVDRAYRKNMERLEELGLVKSAGSGRWKRYEVV